METKTAEKGKLTGKERHFCQEYIGDYNATQAAIRAGYPERSAAKKGCLLLKREQIQEYISQLQQERAQRLSVSADFVMQQTLDLLQKCLGAVKPIKAWNYETHQFEESGEFQLDSKGACRCLELLAKMTGADQAKPADNDEGPVFLCGEEDIPE